MANIVALVQHKKRAVDGCAQEGGREWGINVRQSYRIGAGLAAAFALAGLAGQALAQDKPTVYVIAPSLTDPFWITEQNGANQAGQDFGVNVVFQAPAQDTGDAGMVPLVQAAIAANPAGIAIDYTSKTMEAGHGRRARCRHPGRPLQQQSLRGRERPRATRASSASSFNGQDESMSGETLGKAWLPIAPEGSLQGPDRQSVPDRIRADAARRRREARARRGQISA